MRRFHRTLITTAAASTLAAGAGGVLALAPLAGQPASAPVAQDLAAVPADASQLQAAIDDLAQRTSTLKAELDSARKRLADQQAADAAKAAPAAVQAAPRSAAQAPAQPPARKAPVVHARTGASGGGEHEGGERDDD